MANSHQEEENIEMVMRLRREDKDNYRFFRTTCGLLGFVVFFLGALISFIVAGETGEWYEATLLFGFVMLAATLIVFVCVLHESKKIPSIVAQPSQCPTNRLVVCLPPEDPQEEQGLLVQEQQEQELPPQPGQELPPQPGQELPDKPKKGLHWYDRTRIDAYINRIFRFTAKDLDETTSSENDSDQDILELRKMGKSGLFADKEESMAGTSKESQIGDRAGCEGGAGILLHSTKAGPSKVADQNSEVIESRSDDPLLQGMSALSLSDSSKCSTGSEEKQAEVSAALSQLSLDSSEKQAVKMAAKDPSPTDPESKSDEHPSPQAETSEKAESDSSKLGLKKEA